MASPYLTCLCGAVKSPLSAPVPYATTLCHCNPCRQTTGALYAALPRLSAAPAASALAACQRYDAMGPGAIWRYFCPVCGTHVCAFDARDSQWHAYGGAIEAPGSPPDRLRVTAHIFVDDLRDGGLVGARPALARLRYGDAAAAATPSHPVWLDTEPLSAAALRAAADAAASGPAEPGPGAQLAARCQCGGTDLRLARADFAAGPQGVPAHDLPSRTDRYLAYLCACRSCRLANGAASLHPWASVPAASLTVASTGARVALGKAADEPGANAGTTLRQFWSSERACWSFCGTCGALVLYWHVGRPDGADLAVGVIRADEGAMAAKWLEWKWHEVSHGHEAVDRALYAAVVGTGDAA